MFKHEILDHLKFLVKYLNKKHEDYHHMNVLSSEVKDAIEIHAGQFSSYFSQVEKDINDNQVRYIDNKNMFLPYKKILVSYTDDSESMGLCKPYAQKRSMLVCSDKNCISFHHFLYFAKEKRWGTLAVWALGSVEGSAYIYPFCDSEVTKDLQGELYDEVMITRTILDVLSCKNVNLTPVDPPEKLNKKRIKNGKHPLYRYHVLTVDLDKGRKQSGVGRGANLGTMPVHLCRGHFKEYTDEKPLFGRVTGRFWWQPYARGKAENGVVMKDYEIKKSNV